MVPGNTVEERIALIRRLNAQRCKAKPKAKKQKEETSIQASIVARLETLPYVKVERNNRGAKGNGRVRFGLGDGAADLVGVLRIAIPLPSVYREGDGHTGRFFALEVKRPGEKPDPHQEKWAEEHRALGGYVGCVTSVEEALACVEEARDVSKFGRAD